MVRFIYDPVRKELRAEFDFGLSSIASHFPSRADATVIAYEVPAKWAFRHALARYHDLYPNAFTRRTKSGGIWLPFAPLSAVKNSGDFGFAFHEVAYGDWDSVKFDVCHGVESYVYVEPQTNWRELREGGEHTYAGFMSQLWEDALKGDKKAQATLTSGIKLEDGRYDLYLSPVAYTKSAPFGVNCDPDLSTEEWGKWPNKSQYEQGMLAGPLGWGNQPPVGLSGVYIDSMEGCGEIHNFSCAAWRVTHYPLTFDPTTFKVTLLNFWGTYAFIKDLSQKLHAKGINLMGNDAFYRYWFLAPYVDIPGREYRWIENGKFTPVLDDYYLFFRSMSSRKPYVMLMNNDYDDGSRMEEYFQRSLFYAVYPSMFHGHSKINEVAYFYNPGWYNRDRELFRKYIPLIRRFDLAGWEPVPYADVQPGVIRTECYGKWESGNLAFTLHNPSEKLQNITMNLSRADLHLPRNICAVEWISGKPVRIESTNDKLRIGISIPANGYAVIGLAKASD